jgi:hypothetical protein
LEDIYRAAVERRFDQTAAARQRPTAALSFASQGLDLDARGQAAAGE